MSIAVTSAPALPTGHYGFTGILRSEWTKLWSVRSTIWTLAGTAAVTLGVGLIGTGTTNANWQSMNAAARRTFDPTSLSLHGVIFSQLVFGVLGILVVSGEYRTGTIRATFAATPDRALVLAAKATVFTAVALAAGEILSFAAFLAGQLLLRSPVPHASLGDPGVLRAVAGGGLFLAVLGLFALGLATIIRHTAGAITCYVAALLVLPLLTAALPTVASNAADKFLPATMASTMTSVVQVPGSAPAFAPWTGFAVLCAYVAVTLGAGTWLVTRRDA